MSAVSTPVNRTAARPAVSRTAVVAIAMIAIVAALTLVLVNVLANPGAASAGYDAPFYSQYLQEISAGW
jgi:hypothetical protein